MGDGICNYFPGKTYPINIHSVASMIIFLSRYDQKSRCQPIIEWVFDHLHNEKRKVFYFERKKYYTNKNVYHRWNQSWMYLALSYYKSLN